MNQYFSITRTTIYKIVRDYTFPCCAGLCCCGAAVLPLVLKGDHSATGQVQVSLTYALGFIGVIATVSTLWLSCKTIIDEIETHQIDLIVTKPVPRPLFFLGKVTAVLILEGAMVIVASITTYLSILVQLHSSDFQGDDIKKVNNEVLIARKTFMPQLAGIGLSKKTEFTRRQSGGVIQEHEDQKKMQDQVTEVPVDEETSWAFHQLPKRANVPKLHLRYRMYLESAPMVSHNRTAGVWWVLNPRDNTFHPFAENLITGRFNEVMVPSTMINDIGVLVLKYENRDPQARSVLFQSNDGPSLLYKKAAFWNNLMRSVLLIFWQIVFIAILGCTAATVFSLPMAVFISSSYIVLGILVLSLGLMPADGFLGQSVSWVHKMASLVRLITQYITVPLNQFYPAHNLVNGQLIEVTRMFRDFISLIILRGMPICLLGIWLFSKRELGLVIRK